MTTPLIREEVIDAKKLSWYGEATSIAPISHVLWASIAAVFCATLLIFLVVGTYTRRVHVAGRIIPSSGVIVLNAKNAGIIDDLILKPGDHVNQGQVVAKIIGSDISERSGNASNIILAGLNRQLADLNQQKAQSFIVENTQVDDIKQQINSSESQLAVIENETALASKEKESYANIVARMEPLVNSKDVSELTMQQQQSLLLGSESSLEEIYKAKLSLLTNLQSLKFKVQQIKSDGEQRRSELASSLENIKKSIAETEVTQKSVLVSPVNGTISAVLVAAGSSIGFGSQVVSILPNSGHLLAELDVPTKAVGFIRVGDRVALQYDAYPYQAYGVQLGSVESISPGILTSAQMAQVNGSPKDGASEYLVDVSLDSAKIEVSDKYIDLRSGMSLSADILMDSRPIYKWLLSSIYGMGRT